MKSKLVGLIICGLFAAFASATATAQSPAMAMRANIPFDFIVRGKTLPAGTYTISDALGSPEALVIANNDHLRRSVIFQTELVDAKTAPRRGELIFHRYGNDYYLFEVIDAGDKTGAEALPSRKERAERREYEARGIKTEPETVALVAE